MSHDCTIWRYREKKESWHQKKSTRGHLLFFFSFFYFGTMFKMQQKMASATGRTTNQGLYSNSNSNASIIIDKLYLIPQSYGHKNTRCRLTFSFRKLITGQKCRVSRKLSDNDFAAISAPAARICCFKTFLWLVLQFYSQNRPLCPKRDPVSSKSQIISISFVQISKYEASLESAQLSLP